MESTRKYMAERNLETDTPTNSFCNQVNKSKKKVKLQWMLQERKLTPEEQITNPNQKQYGEIFCQNKLKPKLENIMQTFTITNPQTPTKNKF